ncbi:MAG TPA: hypothetical protein VEX60_14850 [Pyrinomonadaceae bacterium]|nr:hypothetical protein [Pyrinomonadaceae bacterium]
MRLSGVSFAFIAGAFVQIIFGVTVNAADCCAVFDEMKSTIFDETRTEEALPTPASPLPAPTPLDVAVEKIAYKESYEDVFRALKDDNSCSRFFGGPNRAVKVFNQFARQLRSKALGTGTIAVRMSGDYTNFHDAFTGASYRLFDEAAINSNGPFAARVPSTLSAQRQTIGRFPAQTRQARALTLLHELGHLIKGADGKWLLPNDGYDAALSDRNTRTVEKHCVGQLLALED